MPIEIKELVIRAVVGDDEPIKDTPTNSMDVLEVQDAVVRRAVDEVLRILKESKER